MNIIIFGGTGFIGRNLTTNLLADGYDVFIVTRNSQGKLPISGSNVHAIYWNSVSPISSITIPDKIDAIVNLAGESIGKRRWDMSVKEEILASRVRTTRAIVKAINSKIIHSDVLINGSAVGYYGARGDEEVTESEHAGSDFLAEVCQKWEDEAYKVKNGLTRVVTLRTGIVLGDEGALNKMTIPYKYYLGGPLGSGKQWLSWIHVEDLTRIIQFIIEHKEIKGPVNAVSPNPSTMKEFSKALGKTMNRPSWMPVPEFLLKIAMGQMSEMLVHGQKAVPGIISEAGFEYKFPKLEEALKNSM